MRHSTETRQWRSLVTESAVVAILVFLCLLFFWQVLTPDPLDRRWFASGDFTDQFYAFRHFMAQELWSGRLPLWNPYALSGSPFLADIQSAVYYPPGLLVVLLAGRGGLPLLAVELEVIAHYFLISLFTYLLVKRLTGSRLAGLVSGIIYAYGSYLTSYPMLQMAILEGQTWVPLALLAIHRAAEEERGSRKCRSTAWLALGGGALALSALAGHAQTFLLAAYMVTAYLLFAFFPLWQRADTRARVHLVAKALLVPVVALGLSAAQIIPSLEYMQLSTRAQIAFTKAGGGFLYSDLLALILPGLRVIYVGILPLVLALLALVLKRSRDTIFWGIAALLALLLSLGSKTFLYALLYLLAPGFSLFQGQERALQIFALAIAILAGYGIALLMRPMNHTTKHRYTTFCRLLRWATVGAIALALLAYWGSLYLSLTEPGQVSDLLERSVLLVLLLGFTTLVLHLRLGHKLRSWRLSLMIIVIIVLDLFTLNAGRDLQRARARDRFQPPPVVQFLQEQPAPFRIWQAGQLPGNFGTVWQLEDTGGISPLRLRRYQAFLDALPEERARQLLNVGYALTSDAALSDGDLLEEYSNPEEDTYFYRIREPGGAAYLVYSADVEPDDTLALQQMAAPDFDPRGEVILLERPRATLTGQGTGTVQYVERLPHRLMLETDTDADGILVLSEIHYPGWQATVDGQPVPILRADSILRAVEVPAGQHVVEMTFSPLSVKLGLVVSAATLLLCLILCLWCGVKHVRPSAGP